MRLRTAGRGIELGILLQMLKDYGRRERRVLNRIWTEVKVR